MQKIITIATLLSLSACGGGSGSEAPDTPTTSETPKTLETVIPEPTVVNTPANFGTGSGVDGGEISAESSDGLTGVLSISDIDANESEIIEQINTQGSFGTFSISVNGTWSYNITNLASDFTSPEEVFPIASIDGTKHQVTILVKGLFQRIIKISEYNHNTDYENLTPVTDFYESDYILNAQENAWRVTSYAYNNLGHLENETEVRYSFCYGSSCDVEGVGELSYEEITDFSYEYSGDSLTNSYSESTTYNIDEEGKKVINRLELRGYDVSDGQRINSFYKNYRYDDLGENPSYSTNLSTELIYDDSGNVTKQLLSYLSTDETTSSVTDVVPKLRSEYFYHENGELDYYLYNATSKRKRFYDDENRISYMLTSDIDSLGIEDLENSYIEVYNYNDELNAIVIYKASSITIPFDNQYRITDVKTYQYEDTDRCPISTQYRNEIINKKPLVCRINTSYATPSSIPTMLVP